MPYKPEHKARVRTKIVEAARILFNRHGFQDVTIEMIMAQVKLTRGGFYNHFNSKEELYSEAVASFLSGRGARWRADAGVDPAKHEPQTALHMIEGYLSKEHLGDRDGQCPMIALPSDVARSNPAVQQAYQELLLAMTSLFENSLEASSASSRQQALSLAALCVGGMILSRTLPDSTLADEVRLAAFEQAKQVALSSQPD